MPHPLTNCLNLTRNLVCLWWQMLEPCLLLLSYIMNGVLMLKLLNGVLIWKSFVLETGEHAKAAERCLLRRAASNLGTFAKTALEPSANVIGCSLGNTYVSFHIHQIFFAAIASGLGRWMCSPVWFRSSSFLFRETLSLNSSIPFI